MIKMIWSISWKNIWRNKTRSMVVIIAVMLGLFGGTMAVGIMTGWIEQRINSAIYNEISHIQIHNPDYMNNEENKFTINDYGKVKQVLDTIKGVEAFSSRTKSFVMVQSDWAASGLMIEGIDKTNEKKVSHIYKYIVEGDYFEKDSKMPSIVIGSKAAEDLKLLNYQVTDEKLKSLNAEIYSPQLIEKLKKVGDARFRKKSEFKDSLYQVLSSSEAAEFGEVLVKHFSFYRLGAKLTITMTDTAGNVIPSVFRVVGIFKTSNRMFDGITAFVQAKELASETGFNQSQVHEIAIVCTNNQKAFEVTKSLKKLFPDQSIMSWREISPELGYVSDMMKIIDLIYVGIILFALAFGIINTMMMAVLERSKELGMLMAIGMNKKRVFVMIMLESIFLTLTGAFAGMMISSVIISILGKTGIDFSMWAEGFEAIGFSAIVYPMISLRNYLDITGLVIITGIIASLWPARKALKMNPAEALRME